MGALFREGGRRRSRRLEDEMGPLVLDVDGCSTVAPACSISVSLSKNLAIETSLGSPFGVN